MVSLPKDRLLLIIGGGVAALLLIIGLAMALKGKPTKLEPPAPPAGLVVESAQPTKLDPARPMRCFVGGEMVGDLTLAECAKRNGVAAGALDVGIDANGQLGAAVEAGTTFAPLPPSEDTAASPPAAPPAPVVASTPSAPAPAQRVAACWRFEANQWARLSEMPLNSCVQTLYAGRCERPGGAAYGRWGDQTLRLIPRRVEISGDNRVFRTLIEQSDSCALPAVP